MSPVFAVPKMINHSQMQVYDLQLICLISAASLSSFLGQIIQSRAYQLDKAARVSATNYLQIVIGFVWDFLFFKTDLRWTDVLGSAIIISFLAMISLMKAFGWTE